MIGDPIEDFIKKAAGELVSELKDAFVKQKRRKKDLPTNGPCVVEVMVVGLVSGITEQEVCDVLTKSCKSKIVYNLAEFEVLQTKIVNQWLCILRFNFLSPLDPEAAKRQTELALDGELDDFGMLACKVNVNGKP